MTWPEASPPPPEDFIRLPGLFRRWELSDVLDFDREYVLEDAGKCADGTKLVAVYVRAPRREAVR